MLEPGTKAPNFNAIDQNNNNHTLDKYPNKKIILYFYPRDNTPGCTKQAIEFNRIKKELERQNIIIIGVSKDSLLSHQNFAKKYTLKIPILSDPTLSIIKKYKVWKEKSLYGKKYMGIVRTTYLIDKNKKIEQYWSPVKLKNHINEIITYTTKTK